MVDVIQQRLDCLKEEFFELSTKSGKTVEEIEKLDTLEQEVAVAENDLYLLLQ